MDQNTLSTIKKQAGNHVSEILQLIEMLGGQPVTMISTEVTNESFSEYFKKSSHNSMITKIGWDGKPGCFLLLCSLELAIVVSGMMMGLPEKIIKQKIEEFQMSGELEEAYGEIANQFTGVMNKFIVEKTKGDVHLTMGKTERLEKRSVISRELVDEVSYFFVHIQAQIEGYEPFWITWILSENLASDIYDLGIDAPADKLPLEEDIAKAPKAEPVKEKPPEPKKEEVKEEEPAVDYVQVKQIMHTDYPVIEMSKMISEAYDLMKTRNVDCLPVVNDGKIDRVVTRNNIEVIRSPFFDAPGQEERVTRLMCLALSNVNQGQELVSVAPEAPLKEAMEVMVEKRLHSIPVLKEDREFVGVITTHGILEYFNDEN